MSRLHWVEAIGLAAAIGLYALAQALGRSVAASVADMRNPRFTTMGFGDLPGWVRHRIAELRERFFALGFTELTNYTRQSPRVNYTCVLLAPDKTTSVSVWVARSRGLKLWLVAPILGWSAFKNELLASPRYGLITHFPEGRMIETSPVELLKKSHVTGEMEFVIVPSTMPLTEVAERHATAAQSFAARSVAAPVRITSVDEFFNCQREHIARIAAKLRRDHGI